MAFLPRMKRTQVAKSLFGKLSSSHRDRTLMGSIAGQLSLAGTSNHPNLCHLATPNLEGKTTLTTIGID
jgi:hypothetical protein